MSCGANVENVISEKLLLFKYLPFSRLCHKNKFQANSIFYKISSKMKSKVADSMVDECACSEDWTGTSKRTKKINKKFVKKCS